MSSILFGGGTNRRINQLPRTEAQLRDALSRLSKSTEDDSTSLTAVKGRLDVLENLAGEFSATFTSAAAIGQTVYVNGSGTVALAGASSLTTAGVAGFATAAVLATAIGKVAREGRVTKADWTAIVGAANLTAGAIYFLSATTGLLTATAPTAVGGVVVIVGRALSTTTMQYDPQPGVLL